MNRRRPWTPEQEHELLELVSQGVSISRISARLRRSRQAIEGRLSRLRTRDRNGVPVSAPGVEALDPQPSL